MNPRLVELRGKMTQLSTELSAILKEAGDTLDMGKVTSIQGDNAAKAAEIKRRMTEINKLGEEVDSLEDLAKTAADAAKMHTYLTQPAGRFPFPGVVDEGASKEGGNEKSFKSLDDFLSGHNTYMAFKNGSVKTAALAFNKNHRGLLLPEPDTKTLLTLGDFNIPATRLPQIVQMALEERTVRDLMLQGNTAGNTITYMEETTLTNNAATVAEGGTKPESALDFTERTDNVRKIATWLPATRELLQDIPMLASYIRGRLTFMINRTDEVQLLTGNGVAPNILGLLNRVGVQTYAKAGLDSTPDAIYKAMQKVRNTGFAEPTAVVMHPNDWTDIRLMRTADGIYIWGSPSEVGQDRIWGKEIRQTSVMTENTALVGAFRPYAQVFQREEIEITVSTEHASYFIENKIAILAEERKALAVYRPAAFCTATGLTAD